MLTISFVKPTWKAGIPTGITNTMNRKYGALSRAQGNNWQCYVVDLQIDFKKSASAKFEVCKTKRKQKKEFYSIRLNLDQLQLLQKFET